MIEALEKAVNAWNNYTYHFLPYWFKIDNNGSLEVEFISQENLPDELIELIKKKQIRDEAKDM